MTWKFCSNCGTELKGAATCPNCGWQVPRQESKLKPFLNALGFWALMIGVMGGCGYIAYAGVGLLGGFGPLSGNPWMRWIGVAVVALYVVMTIGRGMRRK
jgi:hypothetical protein